MPHEDTQRGGRDEVIKRAVGELGHPLSENATEGGRVRYRRYVHGGLD